MWIAERPSVAHRSARAGPLSANREGPLESREELQREIEVLGERIATLSAAVLRLGSSLELATVLQEAADSARKLTRARYSLIVTIDEAGEVREFVTSGLDADEHRELAEWPDGTRLFAYLRDLPGPFRLDDLSDYFRSLGFSDEMVRTRTLHGTPMRRRGVQVGNFFLAGKEDAPDFTDADDEMLELFASQAAAAIVNARAHQQERRARADLEALIETTPVGVMVVNARTGRPVSSNREALRLIDPLRAPDLPAGALPADVTCRLGDGREIALDGFALAEVMQTADTVRAEEVLLSAPGGRSVSMLVNATPIPGEDGAVASLVVTMQDLAPLEELDRLRAEFLSMVSHELRTPLAAIKGSTATVLTASPALHPTELHQFFRVIDEQADRMRGLIGDLLDAGRIEVGTLSVSPVPTEVSELVEQARSAFLNGGGTHSVLVDLPQDLPLPPRGRPPPGRRRPAAGPAARAGRRPAHRAGAEQPSRQRRPALSRLVADPGRRGARRTACRCLGLGRGQGRAGGATAAAVPEVHRPRRRRRRARPEGVGPRARHLQRPGRSPWRAHPGGERRPGPGHPVHLHPSGGRGLRPGGGSRPRPLPAGRMEREVAAGAGGGR